MLLAKVAILFLIIYSSNGEPLDVTKTLEKAEEERKYNWKSSMVEAIAKPDFNAKRYSRHIGAGGIFGGGGFTAPVYASPSLAVVSSVPVVATVPVVTSIPSYPIYSGYGGYGGSGYGGGFGGFGAGFGFAKFKVKSFGIGGGGFFG